MSSGSSIATGSRLASNWITSLYRGEVITLNLNYKIYTALYYSHGYYFYEG
jgi:hypothetical protein